MSKAMIFIDGTWLYANTAKLAMDYHRPDLQIDYGLLPAAVSNRVTSQLDIAQIDIVRTYLFASYPVNFDPVDHEIVQRRMDFFDFLKEEYHYEVESYSIDFRGRRVRAADRDPADPFGPREKCVDIALASSMLYYAAIPQAYDIAIAIIGDRDYIPVLQLVRRLAKRVAIASIRGSCASEYADPIDQARVKDVDIIWLNDMIPDIELKYESRQLICQSELHSGDRKVWTTYRPRKGQPFYCDECRKLFAERNLFHERDQPNGQPSETYRVAELAGLGENRLTGSIYELKDDRGYGFIRSNGGQEYFFHMTDLDDLAWHDIFKGMPISFSIKREPSLDRAGHAGEIRAEPEHALAGQ